MLDERGLGRPEVVAALPSELLDATACDAARDAAAVAAFLRELGFMPSPDRPIRFPAAFLLRLGAALRLLAWEANGISVHRDSGLPKAEEAILDAFDLLNEPAKGGHGHTTGLPCEVVALSASRFAWHGRRDLDADFLIDDHDGEVALDLLARFLWDSRHAGREDSRTGAHHV